MGEFKPSLCGNCCGLCGSNCHCQWGVTGVLMGIFVMAAAGVFTVFCTFIPIFMWDWYWYLCIFWFGLGCLIFVCGFLHVAFCGCDTMEKAKAAQAREVDYGGETGVLAPTPYIMITA